MSRGCPGRYHCLLWRQTQPYQYRQQSTELVIFSHDTPYREYVTLGSGKCPKCLPEMLSCWELLLWHSLSSMKSSLPSMLIVWRGPAKPVLWKGPVNSHREMIRPSEGGVAQFNSRQIHLIFKHLKHGSQMQKIRIQLPYHNSHSSH